jgi:uncharacterized protein involved in exopolysaccharide biosynthesis/Mrp family chromosome partitioning ATPase
MFAIDTQDGGTSAGRRRPSFSADPFGWALGLIRRYLLLVLLCGLIGLAGGVALALLTYNRFSATTQLLIDPRDFRVLSSEISPQAVNSDAVVAYLESQVRVMASDSIKRRVIDKLGLAGDPDFGGGGGALARLGLGAGDSRQGQDPVLRALAAMDKQVMIRRGERTFVIDITVITGDGAKSARVANAVAETYLEDQTSVRAEAAQRASNSLGARLTELRERVKVAEDKVEKYRAANNLVGAGGKLIGEEQLAISNAQLIQARARTTDASARFEQLRAVRPQSVEAGAAPEALQSGAITSLRAQLGAALTREADAQTLYGPQHPLFVSAQAQVRDARRQIAEELARIVQGARAELDRARSAEAQISQTVERLKRETLTSGAAAVQLRELEREADANRQVYQAFLLRARETGELTNVDTTNARIITTAVAPLEKIGPNRKLFAIIGLLSGLALGVVLAALAELTRMARAAAAASDAPEPSSAPRTASHAGAPASGVASAAAMAGGEDASDARKAMAGAPIQTPAPAAATRFGRWRKPAQAAQAETERSTSGFFQLRLPDARAAKSGGWRKPAAAGRSAFHGAAFPTDGWDEPRSPFGVAMQTLRDRLALEEGGAGNRRTVVLGLQPGVGASAVALNLALASARETATPLLIDLAAGPASLSAVFGDGATLGAEDVISGRAGLIRAALQDDETGAFFLPRPSGGDRLPAPCPARLKDGLFSQTRRFETVTIDAGALSDGALPHLLAEIADDIVIVAPAKLAPEQIDRMARRALGSDAGKIRALVLNEAAP